MPIPNNNNYRVYKLHTHAAEQAENIAGNAAFYCHIVVAYTLHELIQRTYDTLCSATDCGVVLQLLLLKQLKKISYFFLSFEMLFSVAMQNDMLPLMAALSVSTSHTLRIKITRRKYNIIIFVRCVYFSTSLLIKRVAFNCTQWGGYGLILLFCLFFLRTSYSSHDFCCTADQEEPSLIWKWYQIMWHTWKCCLSS